MIKTTVIYPLLLAACSSLTLKEYLLHPPQSDSDYLAILWSKRYGYCHEEFSQLPRNITLPENMELIESVETQYFSLLGVKIQEVPAIRLIKSSGEVFAPLHSFQPYSLNHSQIQDFAHSPELQVNVGKIQVPLTNIDFKLAPLNENRFTEAIYWVAGWQMGYSKMIALLGILLATTSAAVPFFSLYRYVKSHQGQPLETKHAVHLLGFWTLIHMILMTHFHPDFYCHHQWKIISLTKPLNQWYDYYCYRPDYPPLWMYIEVIEAYILNIFFPQDLISTSLLVESAGFRFAAGVLNIALNSTYWFALLKLFCTIQKVYSEPRVTVNVFGYCLFNNVFLYVDGPGRQPNQFIMSIMILSISYMLEKKYLKSAFWYCIAVNVKQITAYYCLGYFLFLLQVYCFTPTFNRKNFCKLVSIVLSTTIPIYLPLLTSLRYISFFLMGGYRPPQQAPMTNLNTIVALRELFTNSNYTGGYVIPTPLKAVLLLISGSLLSKFMRFRQQEKYFPLYCFLSCFAFFHLMNHIHPKHIAYVEIPFLIYALIAQKEYFKYAVVLQALSFFHIIAGFRDVFIFAVKYPMHFYFLWEFKQYVPQFFQYYLIYMIGELIFDINWLFFRTINPIRYIIMVLYTLIFYYKVMRFILRRDSFKKT